jgi:DNA polymerase-3 subunit gamma/tau
MPPAEVTKSNKNIQVPNPEVINQKAPDNSDEAGSMLEDIEVGSGCVADMQKTVNPTPSQKELELNDILNSPMMTKTKELFNIKKITVKAKT